MDEMRQTWFKEVFERMLKDINTYKWVVVAFSIYYFSMQAIFGAFCPMLIITGLPCAGCGMTRAIRYVLVGEFQRAYDLNPIAFMIAILSIWFMIKRYLFGKKIKGFHLMVGLLLLGLLGFYLYRMVIIFPGHPPIVYRYNNILSEVFPIYEKIIKGIWQF